MSINKDKAQTVTVKAITRFIGAFMLIGIIIVLTGLRNNNDNVQEMITPSAPVDQTVLTQTERATWLKADCADTIDWDYKNIPAIAIVRNVETLKVSRSSFDTAFTSAKGGDNYILAYCSK